MTTSFTPPHEQIVDRIPDPTCTDEEMKTFVEQLEEFVYRDMLLRRLFAFSEIMELAGNDFMREFRNANSHCFDNDELVQDYAGPIPKHVSRCEVAKVWDGVDFTVEKVLREALVSAGGSTVARNFLLGMPDERDLMLATIDYATAAKEYYYGKKSLEPSGFSSTFLVARNGGKISFGWRQQFHSIDSNYYHELDDKKRAFQMKNRNRAKGYDSSDGHMLWLLTTTVKARHSIYPLKGGKWDGDTWRSYLEFKVLTARKILKLIPSIYDLWNQEVGKYFSDHPHVAMNAFLNDTPMESRSYYFFKECLETLSDQPNKLRKKLTAAANEANILTCAKTGCGIKYFVYQDDTN